MTAAHSGDSIGQAAHEVTLTDENTFPFLPGGSSAVSCPHCFADQLLVDLIRGGTCRSCGAVVRVTMEVRPED